MPSEFTALFTRVLSPAIGGRRIKIRTHRQEGTQALAVTIRVLHTKPGAGDEITVTKQIRPQVESAAQLHAAMLETMDEAGNEVLRLYKEQQKAKQVD